MRYGAGEWAGYVAYLAFSTALYFLPRRATLALGRGLGRFYFRLSTRHRRIALDNLAIAFGAEKTTAEREAIARASFAHFGQVTLETVKLAHYSRARVLGLIDIEGREHLEKALAAGKGVLAFSAHYGNWETIVPALSSIGPFHVLARRLDNRLVDRHLTAGRTRLGGVIIDKMGAARPILRVLREGGILAIVIDQNVLRIQAVFVDFFGRTAATTPGLASFHLLTGAPLLPVFCEPRDGRHRWTIGPPVEVPLSGRRDEDVLKITAVCTKIIERQIRRAPEWWLWMHKRWNTRPAGETNPR
jgi:Kdo2-lipid IVA lauroyltransferase/acyltransferase